MSFKYAKPTLKVNWSDGSGEVGNLDAWRKNDPVDRINFLRDWIYDLRKEYQFAVDEMLKNKKEIK